MSTPQYRFSYTTFCRYAPTIGSALRTWPGAICVEVANGSVSSHVQPIRDAITTKERKGYAHPSIDETLWKQYGHLIIVSPSEKVIWVGSKDAVTHRRVTALSVIVPPDVRDICYVIKDHGRPLDYAFLLVQAKAIEPLPTLVVESPSEERIKELTLTYPNVALVPVEGTANKYQII